MSKKYSSCQEKAKYLTRFERSLFSEKALRLCWKVVPVLCHLFDCKIYSKGELVYTERQIKNSCYL